MSDFATLKSQHPGEYELFLELMDRWEVDQPTAAEFVLYLEGWKAGAWCSQPS